MHSRLRARLNILFFALVVAGIAFVGASLTIRQSSAIETERTRESVSATVHSRVNRMAALAEDNAVWDDAAAAVYRGAIDRDFVERTWRPTAEARVNYEGVYIFAADGRILYAFNADGGEDASGLSALVATLKGELGPDRASTGGIYVGSHGPELVGIATITSIDPTFPLQKRPTSPDVTLVFTRPLVGAAIHEMGQNLQLQDLAWSPSDLGMAPLIDHGKKVGSINWTPPNHGWAVIWRGMPVLMVATAAGLLAMLLLLRQNGAIIDRLSHLSRHDTLTGLLNRRGFADAVRAARGKPASLALVSLGGLKIINADHGHGVGDALLRACGAYLRSVAGAAKVARLDGDEFAVLTIGDEARTKIGFIAERLSQRAREPLAILGRPLSLSLAIGLSSTDMVATEGELHRMAELALRASKAKPRPSLQWHTAEHDDAQHAEREILIRLRHALNTRSLDVFYQPVFTGNGKRLAGVEALVRWTDDRLGQMNPALFIPIAERHGLVAQLGSLVLDRACCDGLKWPGLRIAVNVSAAQLHNPRFADEVKTITAEAGFPIERLDLEVTETLLISEPSVAQQTVKDLRDLGAGVVLDDFGAGFASIGMVRQFAFSKLKLDRSLIENIAISEHDRLVTAATVMLARALGLKVTAEGIETEEQAMLANLAGCDELQGWLFARAMSADDLSAFLNQRNESSAFRAA